VCEGYASMYIPNIPFAWLYRNGERMNVEPDRTTYAVGISLLLKMVKCVSTFQGTCIGDML
jgi:hypothetical protein